MESPIKVGICVYPLHSEVDNESEIITTENHEVKVSMGEGKGQKSYEIDFKPFYFGNDPTKGQQSSLEKVNERIGEVVLEKAFAGYNATVFTYGSQGTGKSTLMYGLKSQGGIIKQVVKNLFQQADQYDKDISFRCEISYFELCGEMITDLISKRGQIKSQEGVVKVKVKDDATKGIYVDKLSRHIITDIDEALNLYAKGVKNRNRLAALDPESKGTSHSIFNIVFTQACLKDGLPMELVSKINLIDLASRDGYSGHVNGINNIVLQNDDESFDDESLIDEDTPGPLEVLTDIVKSLAARSYGSINPSQSYTSMFPSSPIPYKDTSLTLLMKDALGGNCETIMLCCISPSAKHLRDTLSTLKYGNLARQIKNTPIINEDKNVKLIRALRDEIESLKDAQNKPKDAVKKSDLKKLQRDQELMNRLTGIWEEKWSKAQKMIEDKSLDVSDLGGTGLKLQTKEPHFVSLGGGRLSVGVSIIPIEKGFTRVGSGGEGNEVDLLVTGKGIASEHCLIENDGEAVVLHPKNELISVDGLPISEPTRLPQGCMVCIGRNTYFRFNHPKEADIIKEHIKNSRFSIVPDGVYPDVQLAIEQRRIEMQERETLRAENKRLLAMEQQYVQSLDKLEFEKDQIEHEKIKLQILQQQQQNAANQFDRKVSIQIEELKLQKQELNNFHVEREKILAKEKEIEQHASKINEVRRAKEAKQKNERDRILSAQASLDLQEFEALEASLNNNASPKLRTGKISKEAESLESEKHQLALLELDLLTDDLEFHDQFQDQREELQREKQRLELMEEQHEQLEKDLSEQIQRLQSDRQNELGKISNELIKLQQLEVEQTKAITIIEIERQKLLSAKENEKEKLEKESEMLAKCEADRMHMLEKAADAQQRERDLISKEKMRLLDLEVEHKQALKDLELGMISQQERLERERQLEQEYIDTEQLMLEELEQKQFESARQIEYETQLIQTQVEREKEDSLRRNAANDRFIRDMRHKQEFALKQAEEERRKIQKKREEEQEQLQQERLNMKAMEFEYKDFILKIQHEKEELVQRIQREKDEEISRMKEEWALSSQSSSPSSPNRSVHHEFDPNLLIRKKTSSEKIIQIEEERNRLTELKRQAAEKAELEWMEKKREHERREIEEREIDAKKEYLEQLKRDQELKAEAELQNIQVETEKMRRHEELLKQREEELAELHKERERREELEKLLKNEKHNELLLAKTLTEEKQKLNTLERSLSEEKHKRHEIEKKLQDEEMRNRLNDEKTKNADSRSNGAPSMNGTLKRRQPSYNFSLRSGQSSGNSEDLNLMHHIAAAGHVIENCSAVKINRYSCRGYLLKMGKTRLSMSTWKRRWFVFDRKLRAFCYYQDERKTKSKGILYFQSIQEVYVDASVKRSPNPKTTFCVRTPQRTYMLAASSPIAMSIWIDVIFTGKEGTFLSMTL